MISKKKLIALKYHKDLSAKTNLKAICNTILNFAISRVHEIC